MKYIYTLFLFMLSLHLSAQKVHYVNGSATGNNDGTSWANAFTELESAIDNAADLDEIWIAAGTYRPEDTGDGLFTSYRITNSIKIYGGFEGTESSKNDRIAGQNEVILSGDLAGNDIDDNFQTNREDNLHHVIDIPLNSGVEVDIEDITVSHGHTFTDFDDIGDHHLGAGIRSYSKVNIKNCSFTQNFGRSGSGVALIGVGGSESIVELCSFTNNYSSQQGAGLLLISVVGAQIINSSFVGNTVSRGALYPLECVNIGIRGCEFIDNTCVAADAFGGGVFLWQNRNVIMEDCTFRGNSCGNGSGFYVDGRELPRGTLTLQISNCNFENNEALGYGGGAFYAFSANVGIANSQFKMNSSGDTGGAIYAGGNDKELGIVGCSFDDNTANGGWGGAVTIHGDTSTLSVLRTEFINNTAVTSGGAVVTGFGSLAVLEECFFEANVGVFGGAAFSQNDTSALGLINCEFVGNQSDNVGGAISIASGSEHLIQNCLFELNIASVSGGAIYIGDPDDLDTDTALVLIESSTFVDNIAETQGGGVNIDNSVVFFINNLFTGNSTNGDHGGAIMQNGSIDGYTGIGVLNNTFYENVGRVSSGIGQFTDDIGTAEAFLQNNILYHTLSFDYAIEAGSPTLLSTGGNSIESSSVSGLFNGPEDTEGLAPMMLDPDNGDFCLSDASPCVNTGIEEDAPEEDFFGNLRVGMVDKGYCENQNVTNVIDQREKVQSLKLQPNPASAFTQIEIKWPRAGENATIQCFDALGKEVTQFTIKMTGSNQAIDVTTSGWDSGFYRIRISNDKAYAEETLIKM